jgi:phosphate acetyltransferase
MSKFDHVFVKSRAHPRRILLPESLDPRVLKAASVVHEEGFAIPVLMGKPSDIQQRAEQADVDISGITLIDTTDQTLRDRMSAVMIAKRVPKQVSDSDIEKALDEPVSFACLLLGDGQADGCVAGAATATASVIRSALRYVGTAPGVTLVSSFFAMRMRDHHPVQDLMVIGDCGLMVNPDAAQLAEIAEATGTSAQKLFDLEPEVAMLSFSTHGSARHPAVTKVQEATKRLRQRQPNWRIVGDVQLDAAVIPEILASKYPEAATDSPCNILIFPNLDAGNIGYKLIERFGGAQAVGPILQGLDRPVNDLSRGCSSDDIVNLVAVTAAQVSR